MPSSLIRQGLWGVTNTAIIRGSILVFQLVLAGLLSASDFGIYAVAIAIAGVAQTFRGGGVSQWQVQGGEREHEHRSANAFYIAAMANILLGIGLIAVAAVVGELYSQPELPTLVIIIGATTPFLTTGAYYQTRLQIQLRIRQLTVIEQSSALMRGSLTILFAVLGLGPLSFVLPNLPCYFLEHLLGYYYVREKPWRLRPTVKEWPAALRSTRWAILATFGLTVGLQGDYITLGAFATSTTIGYYYFAYQLTFQSAGVVSTNINRVLTSALVARSREFDPQLFSRATRTIMSFGSPIVLLLTTVMTPLERLLWHGKWSESVAVVTALSLALPIYLLATIVTSALVSSGFFMQWAMLNLVKAAAVVGFALLAGVVSPDSARNIAVIMAIGLCVVHALQCAAGLRVAAFPLARVLRDAAYPLIAAPVLALTASWIFTHIDAGTISWLVGAPITFLTWYALGWAILNRSSLKFAGRPNGSRSFPATQSNIGAEDNNLSTGTADE